MDENTGSQISDATGTLSAGTFGTMLFQLHRS